MQTSCRRGWATVLTVVSIGALLVGGDGVAAQTSGSGNVAITYQYRAAAEGLVLPTGLGAMSISIDGRSVGMTAGRGPGGRLTPSGGERDDLNAVADLDLTTGTRTLRVLELPGYTDINDAAWSFDGQLSGDGRTYVTTFQAYDGVGECDLGTGVNYSNYTSTQIVYWERASRDDDFGDPQLASKLLGATGCHLPSDAGPPQMGVGAGGHSITPSVSEDGSVIAFSSRSGDLVSSPPPSTDKAIYVSEDGPGGRTVSLVTSFDGEVYDLMVSGDGDHIVFSSDAPDVVPGLTVPAGSTQIYLASRGPSGWVLSVVSRQGSGALAEVDSHSGSPSIDGDGSTVAFATTATNLDPTASMPDEGPAIVVRDVASGVTQIVTDPSAPSGGLLHGQAMGADDTIAVAQVALSWDGERVVAMGRTALEGDEQTHLVLATVEDALSSTPGDRRAARTRSIEYGEANTETVAIGGAGPYLIGFAAWGGPTRRYRLDAPALYFVGSGGSAANDPARGWHGDPVDTATGSFRHDETDLPAPAGAGPASLSRSYTTVTDAHGVFGGGWMSDLDTRLEIEPDQVVLHRPNGQVYAYASASSAWEAQDGQREILVEETVGWSLTGPTGAVEEFDDDGRLVARSSPGVPRVEIAWGALAPTSITSASGYTVTLEDWTPGWVWDPVSETIVPDDDPAPDGHIDRATTSDGRQVDYRYHIFGNDPLVAVSQPHAIGQPEGTFGYRGYEMQGSLLVRIVDQVDATRTKVVVENTYDELGRVVHQVTDTGDDLDFAYGQQPDGLGGLDPAVGFTTVTNQASGDVTVYEHNTLGEVIGITDALGNNVERSWAVDRPVSATSRSGVATDHVYDDAGRLVEVTETAGPATRTIETRTYLTPDTSPAALSDDRVATRTDEAGVTTTYTYAGTSRQPETVSVPCDPDSTDAATPCPSSGLATTTYTYHSGGLAGLVASVTDPDGVVTESTYTADRALETTTTYDGATPMTTTYATIRAGDPGWSETDPAAVEVRTTETPGGAVTTQVYDAEGRLIEVRDPEYDGTTHLATQYAHSFDGELTSVTDPAGGVTTHAVARPGDPGWAEDPEITEVRTVTGPDGVSSITKTDRSGDVVVEQRGDPAVPTELATTTHTYGPLGRLESTTDPTGVTTTYEYDVEGRVTAVIDEDGESTETAYDDFGRTSVETDPLGETTTTTYGSDGRVASVEDREGHDTTFAYDDAGRLHTTTDARGGVVERSFTLAGRLASETDATGRTTSYGYDTAGRQVDVELPSGATTTTVYDLDGRVATVTSPEGRVTSFTYDGLGRQLTVVDPATGTTTMTYTPLGQVATVTDAATGQIAYGYDGGQMTTVTDPLGRVTTYAYDTRGNRVSRTDALAGERTWEYDLADRVTKEIDPLGRETTTTHDDLGRPSTQTDGANRTETLAYDAAGQVVSSTFGTSNTTTFGYDGEGRRTTMTSSVGTTTWSYDEVGNITGVDEVGPRDLAWTWDLAGRRVEITLPTGQRQRNVYDADGRMAGVERWDGSSWVHSVDLDLDDDGLVIARDVAGGMDATWDRDSGSGQVDSYVEDLGGTVTTTDLTYDVVGRVATEVGAAGTTTYDYDDAGQLTLADRPGTADDETFAYDELGRRTTSTSGATSTTYAWDAASQLTSRTIGGTTHTYTYDGSGRRTKESWNSGASYRQWAWSSRGELSLVRLVTPSGTDETSRFLRGDGRILSTTSTPAGGSARTTLYAWDTTQEVEQPVWLRIGSSNSVTATYDTAGLARVQCTSTTVDCEGPIAHDALGSAVETADTDDIVVADAYSVYGDPGTAVLDPALGYRSELHTSDLVHLRARDYDPQTGTFLSTDPLDGVDGTTTVSNPYHYTNNDPVNSIDPTGLRPDDDDLLRNAENWLELAIDVTRAVLDTLETSGRCGNVDGLLGIAVSAGFCLIDDGARIGTIQYTGAGLGLGIGSVGSVDIGLFLSNADHINDLKASAYCIGVTGTALPLAEFGFLGGAAQVCLSSTEALASPGSLDPSGPGVELELTGIYSISLGMAWTTTPSLSASVVSTTTWVQEAWKYPGAVKRFCGGRVIPFVGPICHFF